MHRVPHQRVDHEPAVSLPFENESNEVTRGLMKDSTVGGGSLALRQPALFRAVLHGLCKRVSPGIAREVLPTA